MSEFIKFFNDSVTKNDKLALNKIVPMSIIERWHSSLKFGHISNFNVVLEMALWFHLTDVIDDLNELATIVDEEQYKNMFVEIINKVMDAIKKESYFLFLYINSTIGEQLTFNMNNKVN